MALLNLHSGRQYYSSRDSVDEAQPFPRLRVAQERTLPVEIKTDKYSAGLRRLVATDAIRFVTSLDGQDWTYWSLHPV